MFTALMLAVHLLLTVVSICFPQASRAANSRYFAPLILILTAGVNGALLTADLFNLFVFLDVMLLPSYGLYVLSANRYSRYDASTVHASTSPRTCLPPLYTSSVLGS